MSDNLSLLSNSSDIIMAINNSTGLDILQDSETSVALEAFQGVCTAICIAANVPGLFFLFVIVTYLLKKPEGQRTVFDDLVIDNIVTAGFYSVIMTIVMFLGLLSPMPYWVAIAIALPTYIMHHLLFVSCTVTSVIKLLFITQGDTMFDFKDITIRIGSFGLKLAILSILIIIDQTAEGNKNPPVFDLLKTGFESPLKLGLGSQLNTAISIIATLCILFYAKSLNDMDGIKKDLEIISFFGAACSAALLIFAFLFQTSIIPFGAIHFFVTFEIIVIVIILPVVSIQNNQHLRHHLGSYFPENNSVFPIND